MGRTFVLYKKKLGAQNVSSYMQMKNKNSYCIHYVALMIYIMITLRCMKMPFQVEKLEIKVINVDIDCLNHDIELRFIRHLTKIVIII